jgi:hypothetical protein
MYACNNMCEIDGRGETIRFMVGDMYRIHGTMNMIVIVWCVM